MEQLNERFVTLEKEAHIEFEEKRSLFIGHAKRCDTEQEAQEFIKQIKKKYADATHNTYAYSINGGIIARYSDDGEPQGTAGMPGLDAIRKSGVDNACVVVTRYFGGTLLGAGGLVRAYSRATSEAMSAAGVITYEPYSIFKLVCTYSDYQKYAAYFSDIGAIIDQTEFESEVTVVFSVKRRVSDDVRKKISEISFARSALEEIGERYDYR